MTCIVGLVADDGTVYMAGDSAMASGYDLTIKRTPKVFAKNGMTIGVSGYWRMGQILQYLYDFPPHPAGMDTEEYIVTRFVEGLRDAIKEAGNVRKESEQERHDSLILLGYRSQLFEIEGNFQVTDTRHDFDAIGCGAAYALGALYASEGSLANEPLLRLKLALEASEEFSIGVRAPFHFVSMATLAEDNLELDVEEDSNDDKRSDDADADDARSA